MIKRALNTTCSEFVENELAPTDRFLKIVADT